MTEPRSSDPDLSALRMDRGDETSRPRRSRRGLLIGLAALGAVAAVVLLLFPLPWRVTTVETTTAQVVTPSQASAVLTATGYTYARERAAVGSKITGRVVRLPVDEGDRVRAGDVIAVLDDADLRAALAQTRAAVLEAQAELADAERQEARMRALLQADAAAQAEYDAALARLEVARAQVALAEANVKEAEARLGYAVIRSPIPGVVIERRIEVGEMVAPGGFTTQQSTGAIVRIANLESLEVEADINESHLARLTLGQPAVIRVDAAPDREYHGRLRQIVPTADRQRAVVEVKVTIDDRDERLLPDMSCNVTFLQPEEETPGRGGAGERGDGPPGAQGEPGGRDAERAGGPRVLVPREAVVPGDGDAYVVRVAEGRAARTPIELGGEGPGGTVVIVSGLEGGETIVARDAGGLEDGERVRIAE